MSRDPASALAARTAGHHPPELPQHQPGQPGREDGVAGGGPPDRLEQLLTGRRLHQVPGRAGLDRREDVALLAAGGQHEDPHARVPGGDLARRGHAVEHRQAQVEDDHVGPRGGHPTQGLLPVARAAHHLEARRPQVALERLAPDRVVVDDHHPQRPPGLLGHRVPPRARPGYDELDLGALTRRAVHAHGPADVGEPPAHRRLHAQPALPGGLLEPALREADPVVPDGHGHPGRLVLEQDPRAGVGAGVPAHVVEGGTDGAPHGVRRDRGEQHGLAGPRHDDVRGGQPGERGGHVLLAGAVGALGVQRDGRGARGDQRAQPHLLLARQLPDRRGLAADLRPPAAYVGEHLQHRVVDVGGEPLALARGGLQSHGPGQVGAPGPQQLDRPAEQAARDQQQDDGVERGRRQPAHLDEVGRRHAARCQQAGPAPAEHGPGEHGGGGPDAGQRGAPGGDHRTAVDGHGRQHRRAGEGQVGREQPRARRPAAAHPARDHERRPHREHGQDAPAEPGVHVPAARSARTRRWRTQREHAEGVDRVPELGVVGEGVDPQARRHAGRAPGQAPAVPGGSAAGAGGRLLVAAAGLTASALPHGPPAAPTCGRQPAAPSSWRRTRRRTPARTAP